MNGKEFDKFIFDSAKNTDFNFIKAVAKNAMTPEEENDYLVCASIEFVLDNDSGYLDLRKLRKYIKKYGIENVEDINIEQLQKENQDGN